MMRIQLIVVDMITVFEVNGAKIMDFFRLFVENIIERLEISLFLKIISQRKCLYNLFICS